MGMDTTARGNVEASWTSRGRRRRRPPLFDTQARKLRTQIDSRMPSSPEISPTSGPTQSTSDLGMMLRLAATLRLQHGLAGICVCSARKPSSGLVVPICPARGLVDARLEDDPCHIPVRATRAAVGGLAAECPTPRLDPICSRELVRAC